MGCMVRALRLKELPVVWLAKRFREDLVAGIIKRV